MHSPEGSSGLRVLVSKVKSMKQILQDKLSRLDSEREAMYQSVEELSEADLHNPIYGWSIIQVFSHLNDAEIGTVQYMLRKMQAGDKMPEYAFGNQLRLALSKALLQSNLKWKAPKPVSNPEGEYSLDEMKQLWQETREDTRKYVEQYPEKYLKKAVFKHPFAGRLDLAGAIDSLTFHQRHHKHQIKRIKTLLDKN